MSDANRSAQSSDDDEQVHKAGAFDVRTFIALLIGIYGLVLVIVGIVGNNNTATSDDAGININLYAGIGMLVVAAAMQAWAMLRPTVVDEAELAEQKVEQGEDPGDPGDSGD